MAPAVFVAGVGYTPTNGKDNTATQISAATKVFLDAGITFDDVSQGLVAKGTEGIKAFKVFDDRGIDVKEVEAGDELTSSFSQISNGKAQCILTIAANKVCRPLLVSR